MRGQLLFRKRSDLMFLSIFQLTPAQALALGFTPNWGWGIGFWRHTALGFIEE